MSVHPILILPFALALRAGTPFAYALILAGALCCTIGGSAFTAAGVTLTVAGVIAASVSLGAALERAGAGFRK